MTDATPTARYGKLTSSQLSKAIQESDVTTLNKKQLAVYKDCYLAKSLHGAGICLKARHTLTMRENDEPKNRLRYQGAFQKIALDEHVAYISLPHLIYGCEFEGKGKDIVLPPVSQSIT